MASIIDAIIRLRDQFTPTLSHVRAQLSETERVSQRAARDIRRFGNSISGIGEAMLPVAGAIAGGIGFATKSFADFDYTITQAGLKAGAQGEQFKQMSDTVIAAGAKYPISIQEAANAMDRLAAGGFDAGQSMASLAPVIQAAVASGEDMAVVSDVVTSALSTWGMMEGDVAKNAEKVADIVQMASNKSKLGVQDLSVAFAYAAAPAAALGDNLETVTAILGVMANKGIPASTAGTSLRNAFLQLTAGAKPAREAIAKLGLQVFDSQGKFLGIRTLLDQLREKMQGLSQEQAEPLLKDLFGTEGISAVLAYVDTAKEKTDEMYEAMYNSAGSSAAAFEKMNNTFKGQIEATKGAFEAFTIRVGQAAAPILKPFVKSFQEFVVYLNSVPDEKIQQIIKLGMGFIGLTGGFLILGKAVSLFGSFAGFLTPIGRHLAEGGSLAGLFSGRIASLNTAFRTVGQTGLLVARQIGTPFFTLGGIMTAPFRAVRAASGAMFQSLRSGAGTLTVLQSGFSAASTAMRRLTGLSISGLFSGLSSSVGGIFSSITGGISSFVSFIGGVGGKIAGAVTNIVRTFQRFGAIRGTFMLIMNAFRALSAVFVSNPVGLALLAIGVAAIFVARNWETFKQVAETVWQKISYVLSEVITNIKNRFSGLVEHGQQVFNRLVEAWNTLTGSSASSGETISLVINTLGSVFTAGFDIIVTVVEFAINNIFTVLNGLLTVLDGVIQFIVGVFTGNWSAAWEGIKTIFTGIFDTITGIFDNFINAISSGIDRILGKADTASEKAAQAEAASKGEGHNALGTSFWKGGLTWVHEQGPEIIDLPNGTRVIPHSSSLKEEFNRGFSQGTNLISQAAAEMPEQTRAFIAGGAAGVPIENSVSGSSDITPMKEPERDGLGNLSGVDVPEYNIITPEDSISVRRSKMEAQEKQLREQDASGEVAAPGIPADGGGNVERDALGNIQGANIPEYNIIRPEDSISVRRSKQIAQERQVFAATAEETGNATSDTRAAESTGRPESNLQEGISTGRPSSNVQEAEPTGTPSSNVKERTEPPKASPNITVQIPKLADQIVIREKADADYLINQLIYRFQAHAMNRVVHAVR